jgi:fermentation-respiration switch protein FrsA (DUF1100 family)
MDRWRAAAATVLVVVLIMGLSWSLQRRMIYFPDGLPGPVATELPGASEVTFRTADGITLTGWYTPAHEDRPTVLVANGNGGHRGLRAPLGRALMREGLGVLLFDYRGYGGTAGSPSQTGLAQDIRAAREYLVGPAGVATDRLIYYGESLGCAVAADLAREHPPAALALRSPFTTLADVGRAHYPFLPVGLLLRDRYSVLDVVSASDVPVLVVLGTRDRTVPPEMSRAVARAARGDVRLVEVPGADHNDPVLVDGADLVAAVAALATKATPPTP